MNRVYNFSAGPSMLPEAVLQKAAEEMLNYKGSGMSVMEMSHRSKVYISIIENAEALLRKLMNIPDTYSRQNAAAGLFALRRTPLSSSLYIVQGFLLLSWATLRNSICRFQ